MRDLKDLWDPLGARPMPDRWDSIQRRRVGPLPEPHRSRLGAGVAAGGVAVLAIGALVPAYALGVAGGVVPVLAIAVIAWLSPPGGPSEQPTAPTAGRPRSWLVDQAYQLAYAN